MICFSNWEICWGCDVPRFNWEISLSLTLLCRCWLLSIVGRCSEYYPQADTAQNPRTQMKEESALPGLLPLCRGQQARDTGVQLIKNRIKPNGIGNRRMKNALWTAGILLLLWPWEGRQKETAAPFFPCSPLCYQPPQKDPQKCFTSTSAAGGTEI